MLIPTGNPFLFIKDCFLGDSVEQNFQLQLQLFDYLEKYRWKGQILSPPFQILPSKEYADILVSTSQNL